MRHTIIAITAGAAMLAAACGSSRRIASVPAALQQEILEQRADSLFFAAQRSKMLGDYRTAITQYSDYIRLNKKNATVFYELSRLFTEVRNPSYALGFARRAASMDTSNKWFQLALADAFTMNEMFDSAAMVYDKLIRLSPLDEDLLFNKGMALSKGKHYAAALTVFDTLESRVGVVEDLSYQRQRIFMHLGMADEAAAEVRKLISQDPAELRYRGMLAEIYESVGRQGDARKVYDTILQQDPYHPRALIAIANMEKRNGNEPKYRAYLIKAFNNPDYSIDEKISFVYPYLQMLETDTTKRDEGLLLTGLIVESHPGDAKAYALRADMFSQGEMPDSALVNYRKALSLDSTRFSVWYQMMWLYSRTDQQDSLLRVSDHVIGIFPKEFMGYYFNGLANYFKQRHDAAIRSLNKALSIGGERRFVADVYALLGDTYHATGLHNSSDSSYDMVLSLRPRDHLVMNNYSYYLSMRGDKLDKAEQLSRRSLELQPESPTYMDTYAWILFRLGRYREAKEWIEKALQHPEAQQDPDVLEHYGDILFNLNEKDRAVEYWQLAKAKGANSIGLARKIAEKRYIKSVDR
ncbi:tetratricopeptide repeat protein [Chitinophaga sp. XS-30]|uniref:tetratricopeptide repeat protein n=1 Tax=Chitinophaga sp. XS-30 TaxID=2604421 RepID=UPI0011DCC651|nr:tetratricopeptide repeat protein [Chitinophaga sp. XS-30]QEH40669.1 tetratricopeptide repeat protein [Chitinophaga sp. XS-30]